MKRLIFFLLVIGIGLGLTNPNEADFRDYVRQQAGIAGQVGLAVTDLLSGSNKGGIKRENFLIASRFYIGGDGILPKQDLAWGIAGKFIEIKNENADRRK